MPNPRKSITGCLRDEMGGWERQRRSELVRFFQGWVPRVMRARACGMREAMEYLEGVRAPPSLTRQPKSVREAYLMWAKAGADKPAQLNGVDIPAL